MHDLGSSQLQDQLGFQACAGGHLGPFSESLHDEWDDDRSYKLVVVRCEHCGIPVDERDATHDDIDRLSPVFTSVIVDEPEIIEYLNKMDAGCVGQALPRVVHEADLYMKPGLFDDSDNMPNDPAEQERE